MNNIDKYKTELSELEEKGRLLLADLHHEKDKAHKFYSDYQTWYSKALEVIRQLLPNRVQEFC